MTKICSDGEAIGAIGKIATELTGVQLNERHQEMIRSRLQKRMAELGFGAYAEYLKYLERNRDSESPYLIGLLTTHHTFFFREFSHFDYLAKTLLPKLKTELLARPDRTLEVWSAACSRGQEVYSLAMLLDHFLPRIGPSLKYRIYGSDIDPASVAIAKNGVYNRQELKSAPLSLLGNHWARGSGKISEYVKAKKSIRENCDFGVENLLAPEGMARSKKYDVIFCRNVFIYFNPDQIRVITAGLLGSLRETGHLFVGISESLSQLDMPIKALGPSVYIRRPDEKARSPAKAATAKSPQKSAVEVPSGPIRVLCVDDSPSILGLLKRILVPGVGFEIVGTAVNGIVAAEKVLALKPDLVTLDIHMPEMNGVEYLERHFRNGHPPVVMLTSVSREDQTLAGRALSLGASDYIEKPALSTIHDRQEEILWKLKCAFESRGAPARSLSEIDRSFQSAVKITDPRRCRRLIFLSLSDRGRVCRAIKATKLPVGVTTVLAINGATEMLEAIAEALSKEIGRTVSAVRDCTKPFETGGLLLVDAGGLMDAARNAADGKLRTSIEVYGEVSPADRTRLSLWEGARLILEDLGSGRATSGLAEMTDFVVPATSFEYHATEFFAGWGKPKPVAAA